jgi:hypothetical protein
MLRSGILDGIGRDKGTDKAGGVNGGHDYLRKYELFLAPWRDRGFTLLELGVYRGASLKAWEEYFPKARVVGVDQVKSTARHAGGRVEVLVGDLSQTPFVESLAGLGASAVIDDASHWWPDQLRALFILYPSLPPGGVYIVEDIQTSFQPLAPMFASGLDSPPARVLLKIAEYMTANGKPSPLAPDRPLLPLSPDPVFHNEARRIADMTDMAAFIEGACILVRK